MYMSSKYIHCTGSMWIVASVLDGSLLNVNIIFVRSLDKMDIPWFGSDISIVNATTWNVIVECTSLRDCCHVAALHVFPVYDDDLFKISSCPKIVTNHDSLNDTLPSVLLQCTLGNKVLVGLDMYNV